MAKPSQETTRQRGGFGRAQPSQNIRGNRVSPPAVSLSNRTPACGGGKPSRILPRSGGGEDQVPHTFSAPLAVAGVQGARGAVAARRGR